MRVMLTRPQSTLVSYRFPDIGLGYLATGLRNAGFTPVLHVPVNLALSLDIDVAAISVFVPLPGSELFEQLPDQVTRRFTDCAFQNACNDLSQVPSDELHAIAAKAFFRLSLKPSRTLFFLKNLNSFHKWKHLGGSLSRHVRNVLTITS